MQNKHVNAIIVGAGTGGGVVAKELSTSGMSVVLFERGGWVTLDDHDHDELISHRTTAFGLIKASGSPVKIKIRANQIEPGGFCQ